MLTLDRDALAAIAGDPRDRAELEQALSDLGEHLAEVRRHLELGEAMAANLRACLLQRRH